mgnify:CR=1 FL=1
MLEREDTEGAEEAKKAYMAATEESDDLTEVASEEKVLSALIDKVCISSMHEHSPGSIGTLYICSGSLFKGIIFFPDFVGY